MSPSSVSPGVAAPGSSRPSNASGAFVRRRYSLEALQIAPIRNISTASTCGPRSRYDENTARPFHDRPQLYSGLRFDGGVLIAKLRHMAMVVDDIEKTASFYE